MKGKAALSHARRALLTTQYRPAYLWSNRHTSPNDRTALHKDTHWPPRHHTSRRYACDNHLAIAWLTTLGQSEASIYGSHLI